MYAHEIQGWMSGVKITQHGWIGGGYCWFDAASNRWMYGAAGDADVPLCVENIALLFNSNQWDLYTPPKRKVRMWPVLLWDREDKYHWVSGRVFETLEQAQKQYIHVSKPIRLITEWPAVEIEVD